MFKDSWVIYAILSAFFAALTSILAKIGISDINSNLATAIRTIVVLIMAWGIVFMTGAQSGIQDITAKSWIFLVLSGIATGLSWLFYYKAFQSRRILCRRRKIKRSILKHLPYNINPFRRYDIIICRASVF